MRLQPHIRACMNAIGRRIGELRRSKRLSAETCARAAGIWGRGDWLKYEQGRHVPNCVLLFRIADVLGVTVDELRPVMLDPNRSRVILDRAQMLKGIETKDRHTIRWLACRFKTLWNGEKFALEDLLPKNFERRQEFRRRVVRLAQLGYLVYLGGGRYRLYRGLQKKAALA